MDGLEQELGDKLIFIRINIQDDIGRALIPVYHFEFTPTFIYFNAQGNELWREVGSFDPNKVRDTLNAK